MKFVTNEDYDIWKTWLGKGCFPSSSSGVYYKHLKEIDLWKIYHANAKTTARVRKEIQESKESGIKLAKKYSINPKTVFYWKNAGKSNR